MTVAVLTHQTRGQNTSSGLTLVDVAVLDPAIANAILNVRVEVQAWDSTNSKPGGWVIEGRFKVVAGTCAKVGSDHVISSDTDVSSVFATPVLAVSGTGFKVQAAASQGGTNVQWDAALKATILQFA